MEIKKENVLQEFEKMIQKSWTYAKMSKKEKEKLHDVFYHTITEKALKGNTKTRWQILQAVYYSYLIGIGYDNFNWREDPTDEKTSF